FYYVSKNLAGDPMVNGQAWQLAFTGMLDKPYTLSYAQLRALPQVTQYHTLECISNVVGGDLMSNGYFTGVSLADALNTAGIQQGATSLIFKAADGYSDSLHMAQALDERSLIVYLLDGQPLPTAHGYPARLLIPGLYGMKNGKWLTELSVASGDYSGYWEQRGWTPEAKAKMTSRIDTPHDGDLLVARPMSIAGVAYSGAQGIARVDVSVDAGKTWSPARMRSPLDALAWTLWEYPWTPAPGSHTLIVRAIDLQGAVQSYYPAPPLPDGASGYHVISVTAR
ncbi:MAG: molybdopterin-dependent oxidoreductase, partial [Ktedonobacterales bacterium]